jgi:hypothetical protein
MIFPNYFVLCEYAVCVAFLAIGAWIFRVSRNKPDQVQTALRILSVMLLAAGWLVALLHFASAGNDSYSPPIYSPDRKHAIRIDQWNRGPVSGGNWVVLYSFHGLIVDRIAHGEWKSLGPESVKWAGNSEIAITWKDFRTPYWCESAQTIVVRCDPPPPKSQ